DAQKGARAFFESASPSYRRNVLRWIKLAKTDATRTKRLASVAQASGKEEKLPQM
ncbi:MAG: YdeI/OmpD-associated family protein, partial [Pseudomonadota bacterium]